MKETSQEVRKRLYRYAKLDIYIYDYERELKDIQERIKAHKDVGASSLSLTGVRGSDLSDPTASKMLKVDDLQQTYEERLKYIAKKIKRYYSEKEKIEEILDKLTEFQRSIITERFFNRKHWFEVAKILDYTEDYCKKTEAATIKQIATEYWNKK